MLTIDRRINMLPSGSSVLLYSVWISAHMDRWIILIRRLTFNLFNQRTSWQQLHHWIGSSNGPYCRDSWWALPLCCCSVRFSEQAPRVILPSLSLESSGMQMKKRERESNVTVLATSHQIDGAVQSMQRTHFYFTTLEAAITIKVWM